MHGKRRRLPGNVAQEKVEVSETNRYVYIDRKRRNQISFNQLDGDHTLVKEVPNSDLTFTLENIDKAKHKIKPLLLDLREKYAGSLVILLTEVDMDDQEVAALRQAVVKYFNIDAVL